MISKVELNKKEINKKDIKISLVFMLISAFGGLLVALNQMQTLGSVPIPNMSKGAYIGVTLLQSGLLYGLIFGFLGLKLSRATNLNKGLLSNLYTKEKYKIDLNGIKMAVLFGFINAGSIVLADKFIFAELVSVAGDTSFTFSPLYLAMGMVYGGVVEEIMLRLFFMSLVTFILYKVFKRNNDKTNIPSSIYWASIIGAALFFGLGHLPAALTFFTPSVAIVVRTVVMNSLAGILFGYLYWKKGLEYSMIGHMLTHVFMQLLFLPIFA